MMQYLQWLINKTILKIWKSASVRIDLTQNQAFYKLPRSLQWRWIYISYTVTQSFHTKSSIWPHTQSAGGEKKKFGRFSFLSLSFRLTALGVWLLPCQSFPPLQALRAFHLAKVQGQPLLSSPKPFLLSSVHIKMRISISAVAHEISSSTTPRLA